MCFPNLKDSAMTGELTRMLDARRIVLVINVDAATHDNVPSPSRIKLLPYAMQGPRQKSIVRVEEAMDIARRNANSFVYGLGLAGIRFSDHLQVRVSRQY